MEAAKPKSKPVIIAWNPPVTDRSEEDLLKVYSMIGKPDMSAGEIRGKLLSATEAAELRAEQEGLKLYRCRCTPGVLLAALKKSIEPSELALQYIVQSAWWKYGEQQVRLNGED